MKALIYLINISLSIFVGAFILRFLLQVVRANFRNPVVELVTKITNPLIIPLRKVLPPIKKIDTASLIACLISSLGMIIIMQLLLAGTLSQPLDLVWAALRNLLSMTLTLYWILIIFHILISWIQPGSHSPFTALIYQLTEPVLAPARRLIPPIGGLDLSPIPVLILLSAFRVQFGV